VLRRAPARASNRSKSSSLYMNTRKKSGYVVPS
jgi:hypothetical protein